VKIPGKDEMVDLSEISKSGGIVNAFEAMKLAATLKPEGGKQQKLPKSVLNNRRS
jgi:hypothetical protein